MRPLNREAPTSPSAAGRGVVTKQLDEERARTAKLIDAVRDRLTRMAAHREILTTTREQLDALPTWLRDPREVEATQVQARLDRLRTRLDRLRTLGYDEPTDEERARNQFVNVDMPLHLP